MKCDSGITPLNRTAAYDVEVHYDPINVKYAENDKFSYINNMLICMNLKIWTYDQIGGATVNSEEAG